jgi:polar amino acid transport system substrate-binding protein
MKNFILIIILFLLPTISISENRIKAGLFQIVPYAYVEKEKVVGITAEIIQNIKEVSGLNIESKLLPYKRMLIELKSGDIDFAVFFLSEYSESFSEKLIPLYSLETIVIGKKGLIINDVEELYNLRLATPRGVNYNSKLDINKKPLNIRYVMDYKNAILMLERNRIDAIIAPKKILSFQLKQLGKSLEDLGSAFTLIKNTAWLQYSDKSKHKEHKKALIKAGAILLENGKISNIIDKYYSK